MLRSGYRRRQANPPRSQFLDSNQIISDALYGVADDVAADIQEKRARRETNTTKAKYDAALNQIAALEQRIEAYTAANDTPAVIHPIEPSKSSKVSEAALVILASDWHIEEKVDPETVNHKNAYTLAIAKQRADQFFKGVARLSDILSRDVRIDTAVLALLGDFFSGDIHEENLETAQLEPVHAMLLSRDWLASGIEFLLKHTPFNYRIPCHSGNHARTTKDRRYATEAGHSLEYVMYHALAAHFKNEPRVQFTIPKSYHSYLSVFDHTLRFSHGHAIKYGGGVGGPTIAINKAIANWNTVEWADIDCFGHLHQRLDGENFVMNGSLIGYNAFALSIKAKYQKPAQSMFLMDKKRGKTACWPIVFDV